MRLTLRIKFILLSTVLVTIVMAASTYFFTIRELDAKKSAVESQISRIAQNIATIQLLDRQDWSVYQNYISQLMNFNRDIVYIAIYDDRNTLRASTLNLDLIDIERRVLTRRMQADIVKRLDRGAVAEESKEDLRTEKVDIQVGDRVLGSVHVGFSLIQINRDLRRGILLNVALGAVFLLIFGTVSVMLSSRLARPLEKLSRAMAGVAAGNLNQQVVVESRDEIARLAHTFNEMVGGLRERQIIERLGTELAATFRLSRLSQLIVDRLNSAIGAAGTRMFLREGEDAELFLETDRGAETAGARVRLRMKEQIREKILLKPEGFMLEEADEPVRKSLGNLHGEAPLFILPLKVKQDLLGLLIFVPAAAEGAFSEKQQHFAAILAGQAAMALENALLYEELAEQERLKRELEIAREVQQKLLPGEMPDVPGFSIDGVCHSAREVGGDYFDFFTLNERQLGVVVADVSGKGTSASFYMAEIKGMMLHLTSLYSSPKELLSVMNRKLYRNIDRRLFVTMIYGILDTTTRSFVFCRAGHNSLLQVDRQGHHRFLTPAGLGLGLEHGEIFNARLEEVIIDIGPGDALILYTDGVTEFMNTAKEEFGEQRLAGTLDGAEALDAAGLREKILGELEKFGDGAPRHDDVTMVILKCSAG